MDLQHDTGVALWRQIVQTLEAEIRDGSFKPGHRFLTESEIAGRFGVHRHTARRTVAELSQRGLVRVRRGYGTFVEDALISYPVGKRTSFSANLEQQRREPGHRIIDRREIVKELSAETALGGDPQRAGRRVQDLDVAAVRSGERAAAAILAERTS